MKAAKALAERCGIEVGFGSLPKTKHLTRLKSLVDIKLFAELVRVERALDPNQSVAEALAWCGENRGTLKKTKVCSQSR